MSLIFFLNELTKIFKSVKKLAPKIFGGMSNSDDNTLFQFFTYYVVYSQKLILIKFGIID
jgi:hypothetical protein